nr:MAG TPA: hypothetical protein [Caudoviricetes sp.]
MVTIILVEYVRIIRLYLEHYNHIHNRKIYSISQHHHYNI